MKSRDYNTEYRRAAHVQAEPARRGDQTQKPQAISAPGMMNENDVWKRYADSRLKQFSTR